MNVVNYMTIRRSICSTCSCSDCPIGLDNNGFNLPCKDFESEYPHEAAKLVEAWDKANRKTRQTEFLRLYPNVKMNKGVIDIPPCTIDSSYSEGILKHTRCMKTSCHKCRLEYWSHEI